MKMKAPFKEIGTSMGEGACAATTAIIGVISVAGGIAELRELHIVDGLKLIGGGVGLLAAAAVTTVASANTLVNACVPDPFETEASRF